ncbi:hypothetical protein GCM10020369_51540 [Cryptosporangium minutisporangium]|uniref:Uncharacterized protein n=1 Tax=Cryptosporangium minutisporangium TaxID=113569 RepID=A0ABP6T318_9ACTN
MDATSRASADPSSASPGPDGSWRLVREAPDLRSENLANVHGKVRPLHARTPRTCHPSFSHRAVTVVERRSAVCPGTYGPLLRSLVGCPSLVTKNEQEQQRRGSHAPHRHARRSRGGYGDHG